MFVRAVSLVALALLMAAVGACRTDDATPSGLQAQASAVCDDFAARCPLPPADLERCHATAPCFANLVRPEVAEIVFACRATAACDAFDSELCFVPEVAGFTASARWETYEPACLARWRACSAEGAPFENDVCQKPYTAARDEVLDRLQACLDGPCADMRDCEQALVTELCMAP